MLEKWLGPVALVISIVIALIWIPLDVDSGIIEKVRRSITLGDAFAPSVAALLIGIGGCLCLLEKHPRADSNRLNPAPNQPATTDLTAGNIKYLLQILLLLTIGLTVMRYAGPLLVTLTKDGDTTYRALRDTAPWKYTGFAFGGLLIITGLISWVEKRFRFRFLLIGIATVLLLIAIYDLPFDDLLLPPNGDV